MPQPTGQRALKKLMEEMAAELNVNVDDVSATLAPIHDELAVLICGKEEARAGTCMITAYSDRRWAVCWFGELATWNRAAVPACVIAKGAQYIHDFLGNPKRAAS